jgi:beta-glucosidase-like glycosyl hydrolase
MVGQASRLVVAYIQGMQGDDARLRLAPDKLLCMSKVMAGYCVPQGGLKIAPASLGERELRSVYLLPHEAAVRVKNHSTVRYSSYAEPALVWVGHRGLPHCLV